MKETVLIIGVRRKCYQAAIKLGYKVLLWSDGPLSEIRKKNLDGWLEAPYETCDGDISAEVKEFLSKQNISHVLANTESTVVLGARIRKLLGLNPVGFKVAEKFHNKFVMKNCAKEAGVPLTKYELISESTTSEQLIESLDLPIVIKPVDGSGARNVKVARTKIDVQELMQPGLLAEAFVDGSELSVETFVQDGQSIFHNCTEYLHQWKKSVVPASLDQGLKQQILELNDRVIKHFKLHRGMTHAEFYLTKNGPVFGEIAVRPPGGYYMELIQRVYGFDPWEIYIRLSCGEKIESLNEVPNGCTAVMLFHPGSGRLKSIHGGEKVKSHLSEILEFKIRSKPGDSIPEHTSTSNEVGHILFWEKNKEDLLRSIDVVERNFNFLVDSELL